MPDGDFDDLIETTSEGVDVVPSHDMLGDFTSNLEQKISYETGMKTSVERSTHASSSCMICSGTQKRFMSSMTQFSSIQTREPRIFSITRSTHSEHS